MEEDYANYKHFHGMLMEHNNGTTLAETVTVLIPVPLGVVLISLVLQICSSYIQLLSGNLWFQFLIEFFFIVLPLLVNLTVCSNFVYVLVILMGLTCVILLIPTITVVCRARSNLLFIPVQVTKRPYITNLRSSVNLTTSLCILAVDFTVFPRRFAKTDSFGFSLMDAGVGGFIFTNAIVSHEALGVSSRPPATKIWSSVVSCLPLTVIGIARLISVRLFDYYVNVTEYGVDWNFFFTLSVCKVVCTILLYIFTAKYSSILSFIVICLHELLLVSGVQDWVLSATPRDNFLSANREGIISCSGYVALYLAGIGIGRILHSKRLFLRDYLQLAVELMLASLLFLLVGEIVHRHMGVSRRLANFGYFIMTISYNCTFMTIFLVMELTTKLFEFKTKQNCNVKAVDDKKVHKVTFVPIILASISYNGLLFFLLANLFTGFINLCVRPSYASVLGGIFILTLYIFVLCLIIVFLYYKQIKIKVW